MISLKGGSRACRYDVRASFPGRGERSVGLGRWNDSRLDVWYDSFDVKPGANGLVAGKGRNANGAQPARPPSVGPVLPQPGRIGAARHPIGVPQNLEDSAVARLT